MKKQIDRTLSHIQNLERRLNEADNNLRYKVVQALKHSLDKNLQAFLVKKIITIPYYSFTQIE